MNGTSHLANAAYVLYHANSHAGMYPADTISAAVSYWTMEQVTDAERAAALDGLADAMRTSVADIVARYNAR